MNLSLNHLRDSPFAMPQTNLLTAILSKINESVQLRDIALFQGVNIEVLVVNYDFLIKVILQLLLLLRLFFDHVVSRDEYSLEKIST